jgi:EAL domain-containing protein (putative c-di-GMP-specific phosphodiesterase class I)
MLNLKETANELEGMLRDIALKSGIFVPITKDLIRYKKYSVIKLEDGSWAVFHTDPKKRHIASTFLKVSAFAVCKMHEKRLSGRIREIEQNDGIFEKLCELQIDYAQGYGVAKPLPSPDYELYRSQTH